MSQNLSQILADLFAKPMESTALSAQVQRLGDEIRNVICSEDTLFGKFTGLLESFRTIIPDEKQRYQAALQALSTTSKLSRQEIIKAINGQLEELKIVEKGLAPAQQAWRNGLKGMEVREQQLKSELAQLRERVAQLEREEKAVQASTAALEKDLALTEKTVKELFANIGAEISALSEKVEELTAESPAAQPIPQKVSLRSDVSSEKKGGGGQKIEIQAAPPPEDTQFQRKCPMCGGRFNLLELENIWQCYTCAYQEPSQ